MKPRRSWIKIAGLRIVAGMILAYLGAAAISGFVVSEVYLPKLQEVSTKTAEYHEKILADLRLLDGNPIFNDRARTKDAQELISRHVGWEGRNADTPTSPEYKALVAFSADYSKLAKVEDLRKLEKDPRVAAADVTWVDQLESYDHWNLASSPLIKAELGRIGALNGIGRIGVFASMPLPNYGLLHFSALVRFLQLQKSGEPLKGLRLVRHAAYLTYTTPSLIGAMMAVATLRREQRIIESFGIKGWTAVDNERLDTYRRVSWAWGALIHEAIWDTLPNEFQPLMKPQNGVCAMAAERALGIGFQEFLSPRVPLETDFSSQLDRDTKLMSKLFALCSIPEYAVGLEPSPPSSNPLFVSYDWFRRMRSTGESSALEDDSIGINKTRIPFLRRVIAMILLTVATPNYLSQYEKAAQ